MRLQRFFCRKDDFGINLQERNTRTVYAVRIAVNRFFSSAAADPKRSCRRGLLEASGCQG